MRAALFAISLLLTLSACNTVEGFGEDLSDVGEAISDAVS